MTIGDSIPVKSSRKHFDIQLVGGVPVSTVRANTLVRAIEAELERKARARRRPFLIEPRKRDSDGNLMHFCSGCGAYQSPKAFYKDKSRKSGLDAYCKTCRKPMDHAKYLKRKARQERPKIA